MRDYSIRILLAAIMSLSCAAITFLWSRHHLAPTVVKRAEPVALVVDALNEVERRPADRLIWQRVLQSQELYPREAIRTSSHGEAKIEFLDGKTTLELDPDTAIEIERSEGHIDLSFLKGNLTIHSLKADGVNREPSQDQLRLSMNGQLVPIAHADVQVNQERGKPAEIMLLAGKVESLAPELQASIKTKQTDRVEVLRPLGSELLSSPPGAGDEVEFKFRPLPTDYQVRLSLGPARGELTPVKEAGLVNGALGSIHCRVPPGKHYFQLIAERGGLVKSPPTSSASAIAMQSAIYKIEVVPRIAARPRTPAQDARVELVKTGQELTFSWENPGRLQDLIVELASSPDLKQDKSIVHVPNQLEAQISVPGQKLRKIYWRVSGASPMGGHNSGQVLMVSSPVQSFTLVAPGTKSVAPPAAVIPPLASAPVAAPLTPPSSAQLLPVAKTELASARTPASQKPDADPASADGDDETPKELPKLKWRDGRTQARNLYRSAQPELDLAWYPGPGDPISWRVHLSGGGVGETGQGLVGNLVADATHEVQEPRIHLVLKGPGVYRIRVESVDAEGDVVAESPERTQELVLAPPLAAPKITTSMTDDALQASDRGELDLNWQAVSGAKSYVLKITDAQGEVVQTQTVTETHLHLAHLKPGRLAVDLRTIDRVDQVSARPESCALQVPDYSDVEAPKLKNVKIK